MKGLFLLLLLLGQSNLVEAQLDQDWEVKLNAAQDLLHTDVESGLAALDSLISSGFESVHDSTEAKTKKLHGIFSASSGNIEGSIRDFEDAKTLFEKLGLIDEVSDSWFNIATANIYQGNLDEAALGYLRAIRSCIPCQDSSLVAQCYSHLANVLNLTGDVDEARVYLDKAAAIATKDRTIAYIKSLKAILSHQDGNDEDALETMEATISELDPSVNPQDYACALANKVALMENSSIRSKHVEEIESILQDNPNDYAKLIGAPILYDFYMSVGKIDQAEDWYAKGIALAKDLGNDLDGGLLLAKKGELQFGKNNFEEAIPILQESSEILINAGAYGEAERLMEMTKSAYVTLGDKANENKLTMVISLMKQERVSAREERQRVSEDIDLVNSQLAKPHSKPKEEGDNSGFSLLGMDGYTWFILLVTLVLLLSWLLFVPSKKIQQ